MDFWRDNFLCKVVQIECSRIYNYGGVSTAQSWGMQSIFRKINIPGTLIPTTIKKRAAKKPNVPPKKRKFLSMFRTFIVTEKMHIFNLILV